MRNLLSLRFARWMIVVTASVVVSWLIWGRIGRQDTMQRFRVLAATTSTVPYYVHQVNYSHRPDGSVVLTSYETFARRGDGATFEKSESLTPEGKLVNSTRRFGLPGGLMIDTEDVAGLMTAMRLPNGDERRSKAQWDPSAQCAKTFGGGSLPAWSKITEEHILGFAAFKAITDTVRARTTVWRARDLGCVILKGMLELKDSSGQVTGWAEATADSIQQGDPPTELFAIPVTLKNVAPSARVKGNPLNHAGEVPDAVRNQDDLFAKYKASVP
jgi:hypothetical protein